jgi:4-hydroxy-tetrahydrodipicolinate synthase
MDKKLVLAGVMTAVVTPFNERLEVDEPALRTYVSRMIELGASGILTTGYTGEISVLSPKEQLEITRICANEIGGRVPLVGCVDTQSLSEAIEFAKASKAAGADAVQINSPFQSLLRRGYLATPDASVGFYQALSVQADVPMSVFQYPAWSGLQYSTETMNRLADIENVVAVKEATELDKYIEEAAILRGRVAILADNNGYTLLAMLLNGADGTMVGISNIGTHLWIQLWNAVQRGDFKDAVELTNTRLVPLMDCFIRDLGRTPASFVARVKEALAMMGHIPCAAVRQPEPAVTEEQREQIRKALSAAGLLA